MYVTSFPAVSGLFHADELSQFGSANRDRWELLGLVSALRGRVDVTNVWLDVSVPHADEGREFGPQALGASSQDLSLPAVDGRVPLPQEEGRPVRQLGDPVPPSEVEGDSAEEPQAFIVVEDERLPQLCVPLT